MAEDLVAEARALATWCDERFAVQSDPSGLLGHLLGRLADRVEQAERLVFLMSLGHHEVFAARDDGETKFYVMCNDYFDPAADFEPIELADVNDLHAAWHRDGSLMQWVADRRGIPNVHWRKRLAIRENSPPSEAPAPREEAPE